MTAINTKATATELWTGINKEITGIQLLWEAVNGLYFQQQGKEWRALQADAPLLVHLTQTALMETLVMRVSRLMDPAATGRGNGAKPNLSLKQLVAANASIDADEKTLRVIWNKSKLKAVRNKYLSHNDLDRSLSVQHTLNIPLEPEDIEALRQLAEGLRTLRRNVNPKLGGDAYVNQKLDLQVMREIGVLGQSLLGGRLFFELLPQHAALQQVLASAEAPQ